MHYFAKFTKYNDPEAILRKTCVSTVGSESDCRSMGSEFDASLVQHFQ